jgi:glyoxylate/hydroxypyruvate reductase A
MRAPETTRVLIASPFEAEHVSRIAAVDPRVEVLYAPELLPLARYTADHHGPPRDLSGAELERWRGMLAATDISLDFDWLAPEAMAANCPQLRWVQATSSGIGQFPAVAALAGTDITFTTAAGVHAVPLAEFVLAGLLYFIKDFPALEQRKAARHWERYVTRQLAGRQVMVVGLGQVGRQVAALLTAAGVTIWAVAREPAATAPDGVRVIGRSAMDEALPEMDAVVLCCPLTPETRGLFDARRLRLLPRGAIVVNIARGPVIDEDAMAGALADGHLGGACLDVFAVEPLPPGSPLWGMSNVIVSPHSASTVENENALIADLFCDNLRRWLDGQPLRNVYSHARGY